MRPLHTPICILAAGATLLLAASASSFTWTETIDGDLSGNRLAPSAFVASAGANVLSMTSGSASGSTDRDYFTITVPGGLQLSSILLLAAEVDGAGAYTFWAQDFGFEASYSMQFDLAPIPEPAALTLLSGGLALLARWRRSSPAR